MTKRDRWLTETEKKAIIDYHIQHPLEGYRRLTYMMIDEGVAAVSPASVYRVLSSAGRLKRWNRRSSKGKRVTRPDAPHLHWHVDVYYINIKGTFYYLCWVLDGYSRSILHFEIRERMEERHVQTVIQRCREKYAGTTPRITTDNGPQFVAKDFKEFIQIAGMPHVKTSRYYSQSNGKIE